MVELAAEIGRAAAFDLSLVAPKLPPFPCPDGPDGRPLTEMQYLRALVLEGARRRYGDRPAPHEDLSLRARAWRTIDHELDVIEGLGFAGYFLVVWDILQRCRGKGIEWITRGSAADSLVCYCLRISVLLSASSLITALTIRTPKRIVHSTHGFRFVLGQ